MHILAVIPARGGSKRLPGKNVKPLASLPLIAWTIKTALDSKVFCDVLVSTDDSDVAMVAREHGATVPWVRPAELATDTASAVDVLIHAVNEHEVKEHVRLDGVMLLQPTSPFRRVQTIHEAVSTYRQSHGLSVIAVSPAATHPYWCINVDEHGNGVPFSENGLNHRSQELPPIYQVNGVLYLVSVEYLKSKRTLYTEPFRPVIIADPIESIDIDTPFDWDIAQTFASKLDRSNR